MLSHNSDVDTASETIKLINALGGPSFETCSSYWGEASDVPVYTSDGEQWFFSSATRTVDTMDCNTGASAGKHRLCFCLASQNGITPAPTPACAEDDFSDFRSDIWQAQCAGCSYSEGYLRIAGDAQAMRTTRTFQAPLRLEGRLQKNSRCDDHFVAVSTSPAYSQQFGNSANTVLFVWNCETKYVYDHPHH